MSLNPMQVEGLLPDDTRIERLLQAVSLEAGLAVGGALAALGFALSVYALGRYSAVHFGALDPVKIMRLVIPAAVSLALGGQTVLSSFLLSLLLLPQMPERWVAKQPPLCDLEHEVAPSVSTAD